MFSQFYGSFLLNKKLVTPEELTKAFEIKKSTRMKLGVLAINEGLMSASQVEHVNATQQNIDKRFGDLAVELGYLTDEDVESLLAKQPTGYLILGQALVNMGALSNFDFEKSIKEYRENYEIDDDKTDKQGETISKLISSFYHFGTAQKAKINTDYVEFLLKNIIRFIGDDFTPLECMTVSEIEARHIVTQKIQGEQYESLTGICGGITEYVEIAGRFAKEKFTEVDDFVIASMGELLNVINGLFAVNESNYYGFELTMQPQEYCESGKVTFSKPAFCIPIVFGFGEVDFIISTK